LTNIPFNSILINHKQTAEILIDDDSFYHDLLANNWLLSMEYERKLSIRARTLVDRYASKFPERTGAIGLLEPAQENRDLEIAILRKHPKKSADLPTEEEVSSEDSEDEVDLSESPKLPTRNYSSSPATSASNDADRASIMHVDSHDETQPSRVVEKGPLVKLRRSGRFRISDIQRNTHTKLTVNETQQNNLVSQRRDVDHNVLNQVRSFRLVGGATSIERPYICLEDRQDICRGLELGQLSTAEKRLLEHSVLHVDFCSEELEFIRTIIQTYKRLVPDPHVEISSLMANEESNIPTLIRLIQEKARLPEQYVGRTLIRNRDSTSLAAFLRDAATGNIAANSNMTKAIRLQARPLLSNPRIAPQPSISSMLRQREILGLRQRRGSKGLRPFRMEVYSKIEDSLVHQREWVDCCGDISSLSWTGAGDTTFICGALAHSDSHNMQYNKPGNLLVGSVPLDTLKALADHRIVRPIVSDKVNAENSLEAMRQTQDPWLYTSVVSTSHSKTNGFSFTASFDKSVRVWKVAEDGSSMDLCSTWDHEEKVNFVVTSDHHDLVATASDVSSGAIRVYCFDTKNATSFFYNTYNGDRSQEQALKVRENDNWAYFPATIAWGRAPKVSNHLLVGYSPRSITVDESEIPEDKKNTGELCLWNVDSGSRISIASAHTQNVFEVLWHPTQPIFLAATSPCGLFEPADTKTQIRVFGQNEVGVFINIKTLDCPALDINELTIMATSDRNSYVTASCTDANTYVWDTAQGDRPLHVLGHGGKDIQWYKFETIRLIFARFTR
jgi:WD40 repeat protein